MTWLVMLTSGTCLDLFNANKLHYFHLSVNFYVSNYSFKIIYLPNDVKILDIAHMRKDLLVFVLPLNQPTPVLEISMMLLFKSV